mmetsp:Transcript_8054/g.11716  ORF Transcript_8054/g.11716 Transcript_8054/m.11716 type:complete len:240 (-) Transcript_8054:891-1610(-)
MLSRSAADLAFSTSSASSSMSSSAAAPRCSSPLVPRMRNGSCVPALPEILTVLRPHSSRSSGANPPSSPRHGLARRRSMGRVLRTLLNRAYSGSSSSASSLGQEARPGSSSRTMSDVSRSIDFMCSLESSVLLLSMTIFRRFFILLGPTVLFLFFFGAAEADSSSNPEISRSPRVERRRDSSSLEEPTLRRPESSLGWWSEVSTSKSTSPPPKSGSDMVGEPGLPSVEPSFMGVSLICN